MRNRDWNIQRKGRAWVAGEAMKRYYLTPNKMEMIRGKLFWSEREQTTMLGLLLENVGVDKTVRLVDPDVRRAAIAALPKSDGPDTTNA
jgi:hypothetical protein